MNGLLFLMFLYENMSKKEWLEKFNSNILTVLCYLVADKLSGQKEQLINLIINFISFEWEE